MKSQFGLVRLLQVMLASIILATAPFSANSQSYPTKPVRIVVPSAPGAVDDTLARIVGRRLEQTLGQPFIVENKPGAGQILGTSFVVGAAPDGYTLLWTYDGTLVFQPLTAKNLPYDVSKDLTPVATMGYINLMLVVPSSLGINSFKELVTYAKANNGKLSFGSNGHGGQVHLMGEMFKKTTATDIVHVPYKGTALALTDLMGGGLLFGVGGISSILPFLKDGRLKALAISGDGRSSLLPDIPTFAEVGFPEMDLGAWHAIMAPAKTPKDIVAKLNSAVNAVLAEPAIEKEFNGRAIIRMKKTPEELIAYVQSERGRIANMIRTSGLIVD